MKYSGWVTLIKLWSSGHNDILPSDPRWRYKVEGGFLIFEGKGPPLCVGIPVGTVPFRKFYYLISHWRASVNARTRIEELGGIPVLEHELIPRAEEAGCRPNALRRTDTESDEEALQFVRDWVRSRGSLPVNAAKGIFWRRKYRLQAKEDGLYVGRNVRGRIKTTRVSRFDAELRLRVLGQVGHSECLNWVKDAILVSFSREKGRGRFKEEEGILRDGELHFLLAPGEKALPVSSTPVYLDPQIKPGLFKEIINE